MMNPSGTKLSSPFHALSTPEIDVVIPTLNEEAHIELTLRLLFADGWKKEAITVVDGGSTDQTIALAESYGVTVRTCHCGRAEQLELGAQHSSRDALLFLHADTQLQRGSHDALKSALRSGAHAGCFKRQFSGKSWIFSLTSALAGLRAQLLGITYGDQAMWIRRDVLKTLDGVPQQACFEDVELGLRARKLGLLTVLSPPLLTSARRFNTGKLRTLWKDAFVTWRYVIRRILKIQ